MKDIKTKAVIYTDGSADNMKKIYGYGAHGYIFNLEDESCKTVNKPEKVVVTDVGYLEPGELKVIPHTVVNPISYFDMFGNDVENGTNNIAEALAILDTIKELIKLEINEILIFTDSKYAMHVAEKSLERTLEEINKVVDTNPQLHVMGRHIHDELISKNIKLEIRKIKAHQGYLGNETADDLALLGRLESQRKVPTDVNLVLSEPKGYWKPKYERHPFLNTKQIFFTMDEPNYPDNSMEYKILNYKKENEVGKRLHTATYGLVMLKDKDNYVEDVKTVFKDIMQGHSVPSTVRMDNLFRADVFRYFDRYGSKVLTVDKTKNNKALTVLENDVIANTINPPALAFKAMDDLNSLRMIYSDYKKSSLDDNYTSPREIIDITDMFYTKDDKDRTIIIPEITNDVKSMKYAYTKDNMKGDINIQLGTDILTRNQIKKIEKLEPKISLIIANNNNVTINYYLIVELNKTGDSSIWTNYYANTVLLKEKKK